MLLQGVNPFDMGDTITGCPNNGARYQHDCADCIFLDQYYDYDLYYCDHGGRTLPTVIARFGDQGPYYTSGISLAKVDRRLHIAVELAKTRGLIK